ncbi:MAG TPA: ABC-type transport auxiliary lipoprotein family protein [Magnetospirillum sp.]|nr:ABC-type transport auxiliary lipoprotein family protein [Magnetospirillum sp.]
MNYPRPSVMGMAAICAALAACASPAPPRDNFYRLDAVPRVAAVQRAVLPGVLEVNRPDVDGVLTERGLAYQEKDGALARYSYDLWSDAPATALQLALAETLRDAHAAEQVVTPDLRVPPDWMVRGRLFRFEYLPSQGKVAVKLQLAVVSARDGTLVLLETYAAEPAVQGAGPEAAVAALNHATADIYSRFVADLAKAPIPVRHP